MGTIKKLVLASLVVTLMVLTFAIGVLPSSNLMGVAASSGDGRVDMVDLLNLILGIDKRADTATIISPQTGATIKVLSGSTVALLPVQANATPAANAGDVKFGIDGESDGTSWNPGATGLTSQVPLLSVGPPVVGLINILSLATTPASTHALYALTQAAAGGGIYTYDILDEISISIEEVDAAVFDTNGDGIPDNPFVDLGPGEVFLGTVLGADGSTIKVVAVVDLGAPAPKQGSPLGIIVSLPSGGIEVRIATPTLAELQTAGVIPMGAGVEAVLIAAVAPDLSTLTTPTDATNAGALPNAVAFGGQFVQLGIVYSMDSGATFNEVNNVPANLAVAMAMYGLSIPIPTLTGAAFHSHVTNIGNSLAITIPTGQNWTRRTGSTLNALNTSMSAYFEYFSIFAPLQSLLSITDIYPTVGPVAGGTRIKINGSFPGLDAVGAAATVSVGGNLATSVSIFSVYMIYADTPPATNQTSQSIVDVVVADANTTSDFTTLVGAFTYLAPPTIITVTPAAGPAAGGDTVTITGTGLNQAASVSIAGVAQPGFVVNSDSQITVTTVAAAAGTTGTTTVTTPVGSATSVDTYTYQGVPSITGFSPNTGSETGGTTVVIDGLNLSSVQSVTIAGIPATFVKGIAGTVTATTGPAAAATTGPVVVVTLGGTAPSATDFTYTAEPATITGVTPLTGPIAGGTAVVITGTFLNNNPSVTLAGVAATITATTATQLDVTSGVTGAATSGPVEVTTDAGMVTFGTWTYTDIVVGAPTITSFSPASGPIAGATPVTILGTDLTGVTSVTVAGVAVAGGDITEISATQLNIVTAATGAAVSGVITVVTAAGSGDSATNFSYLAPSALSVTGMDPTDAWAFGGVVAQITGTGFTSGGTPTVTFGTAAATIIGGASDTLINVLVPEAPGGNSTVVDVTVTAGGSSAMAPTQFTYSRVSTSGGVTTTAATLASGTGTVTIDLGGSTASLTIPTGTGQKRVLARASKVPADFALSPETAGTGTNIAGAWVFDIHLYTDVTFTTAPAFTAGGVSAVTEVTAGEVFTPANPATLSFPVGSANLTIPDVAMGTVSIFRESSTLSHVTPSATPAFGAGGAEEFHSNILVLAGEVTPATGVAAVTNFNNLRILGLGSIAVRTGHQLNLNTLGLGITFDATLNSSGPIDGNTRARIISTGGGLGYIGRIQFGTGLTKQIVAVDGVLVAGTHDGEDEFLVEVMTPAVNEIGLSDVALFLDSNLNTSAFIIPGAFTFTAAVPPPVPPDLTILFALLALIGLGGALGGDGGGGGGPCFIATAAYGTPMAEEIDVLRAVRDTYLLDSAVGTAFVDTYYRISPAIADVVAQNPVLASLMRMLLMPVIFMSKMILAAPAASAIALFMLGVFALHRRARRNKA